MQALSDFLRTTMLGQTLGSDAYVVPHIIKVDTEDDSTTYTVTINGVAHEYEAVSNDTTVEILDGLKAEIDVSTEPVEADRFVDEDAVEALRVRQEANTSQNYVLAVSANGTGSLSVTQQVYAAVFTDSPSTFGLSGELDKNGYERSVISFGSVANGLAESDEDLVFGPAEEDWGSITHAGVVDQFEGGNLLYFGELAESRDILENDKIEILASNLKITVN